MPRDTSRSRSPRRKREYDGRSGRRESYDRRERRDREAKDRGESDGRRQDGEGYRDRWRDGERVKERERESDRRRGKDRHTERERDRRKDGEGKKGGRRDEDEDEESEDSEDDFLDLRQLGVRRITEDDFTAKSAELRYWLRKARGVYLDEMSSSEARRYFRKFVRRWNDGALRKKYYQPLADTSSNAAHKVSFAKGHSASNDGRHERSSHPTRPSSSSLTRLRSRSRSPGPHPDSPDLQKGGQSQPSDSEEEIGPSLPSHLLVAHTSAHQGPFHPSSSDRQLAREDEQIAHKSARKASSRQAYERAEEAVPRAIGKEGKLAEKKASNEIQKEMRDKDVGGLEVDDKTLMGDENSFQAALRARDIAAGRRAEQRAQELADRRAADQERLAERRQKEATTMDMFKALARQRFG